MSGPTDAQRGKDRIQHERLRWWQLAESYRRCVQIARDEWDVELASATAEQYALALTMRDRVREGTRATGAKFEADISVPVPLFTPRDKLQFVKEVAATLLISADRQNMPVTPEGKRAAQKADEEKPLEAGSGVNETDGDEERRELADAPEITVSGNPLTGPCGTVTVSEAPAS